MEKVMPPRKEFHLIIQFHFGDRCRGFTPCQTLEESMIFIWFYRTVHEIGGEEISQGHERVDSFAPGLFMQFLQVFFFLKLLFGILATFRDTLELGETPDADKTVAAPQMMVQKSQFVVP